MPYYDALLPLLGFRKLKDHNWTDDDGFFFQFREAKPGTGPYERFGAGMNHLGFGAGSAEFVHGVREAMTLAGFEVPEIQDLGGATALFMKDPDGIRFEITHYPPGVNVVD
jgi:catechol 2,3-dioxygenase-like lactoylglutathione lyase family enzyme